MPTLRSSATYMDLELLYRLGISKLRECQERFIDVLRQSDRDLMIILPTGYGKSLAHQVAPFLAKERCQVENCIGHTALVVMPLRRLMLDQVDFLTKNGIRAIIVNNAEEMGMVLKDNTITHVFISPETLLNVIQMISHDRCRFSPLLVDESHCISRWGQSHNKTKAFRSKFSRIGEIRATLPSIIITAMTATATKAVTNNIKTSLHLVEPAMIRISPEKQNIRYCVLKTSGEISHQFKWLHKYIKLHGDQSKRMLIFCKKYSHIESIYRYLNFKHQGLVEQYHASLPSDVQDRIAATFMDPASQLKVVVCSSSFSMGIDIPQLYTIVHYGIPSDLDMYAQESGRGGRDGKQSHSIVLYHSDSLKGTHVTGASKDYVLSKVCRRAGLLAYFDETVSNAYLPLHRCCDLCTLRCDCDNHSPGLSIPELFMSQGETSDDSDGYSSSSSLSTESDY